MSRAHLDNWWVQQPWYRGIRGKKYHWNRSGLLEKLLQLPRLDKPDTSGENGFVRVIDPGDLPVRREEDALRALRNC